MPDFDFEDEGDVGLAIEIIVDGRSFGAFTETAWLSAAKGLDLDGDSVWLSSRKVDAIKSLKSRHAFILRKSTGNETIEERDTWAPKLSAAEAFLANEARPYQLALIAAEGGDTPEEMQAFAELIVARATSYYMLIGIAGRIRREGKAAIKAAANVDELDAILAGLEAQAAKAIADFEVAIAAAQAGA